jgi:LiaI-LiaF-like transmembrane region
MQMKQLYAPESAWEPIAIAVVLIATGTILLGGDYLGFLSLDNVRNLWPLALIAIGVMDLKAAAGREG